jgi:3-phenylpropionate/trans-cinnamate dioxygenase ferredoxin subunit
VRETADPESLPFHDVAAMDAVGPGRAVGFEVGGRRLIVCNAGGDFYAVADRCTHAAWPLAGGDLEGSELICSLHGGRFDLRTGAAACPPATKPLRTFDVATRDGRILVRVPPPVE